MGVKPAPSPSKALLLGDSAAMQDIRRTIAQVAPTNLTVLLQGESGTGKEVVARLLGAGRPRGFVKVNCAAIPQELWESELFGYEPGAFTGAQRQKSGKFELAGGGTMFLDEIGEMPMHLQAKLLQVLQDGEISRLGGHHALTVDVRVVAASNRNLAEAVAAREFRRDLYYRLNVIPLHLPPLRERPEDVPLLLHHFLGRYAEELQLLPPPLSLAIEQRLLAYHWPGNVRQLENLMKRHVALQDESALLAELAAASSAPSGVAIMAAATEADGDTLLDIGRRASDAAQRAVLLRVLTETRWNRKLAAERLGISYKSLQNKVHQLLETAPA